jgi:hypothetical protein
MEIRVSHLPEQSKTRLLTALKKPPDGTFVVSESKLKWAWIGLLACGLGIWAVMSAADGYKWPPDDRWGYLIPFIVAIVIGFSSLTYLFSWYRSDFKVQFLVNPLYFLRFRFNYIDAIPFTGEKVWRIEHLRDTKGAYTGTKYYFRAENGQEIRVKTTSIRTANDLIEALNQFPEYVSSLVQRQDRQTLYFYDLLYEWRAQNQQYPQNQRSTPRGIAFVIQKLVPSLLAALIGTAVFFLAVLAYNDYRDDEIRWGTAKSSQTASGYRLYAASRPDGRHLYEAHEEIGRLYERAAARYRTSSGDSSASGVEVVIKMLEYAKSTGNYKVFVFFVCDDQIPTDVEARLRRATGLSKIVPILPSFTPSMNQAREARILQKIAESFGKVIPGDILQFSVGRGAPQEIKFTVQYAIRATGEVYYPVSQEKLEAAGRDWYTGIGFDWGFFVAVPDGESSRFQFSLQSEPAQLFHVGYSKSASESSDLVPTAVYSAMADSAFDDFGGKLLTQLAVK